MMKQGFQMATALMPLSAPFGAHGDMADRAAEAGV